jgi:predicted transcriptional regulator
MPIISNGQIVRPRTFDPDAKTKPERVFEFIVAFKHEHDGNSPTIREIMVNCRISSTSMVCFYLNQLVAKGLIKRPDANIEVVGGKWIFIGGHHG